MDWKYCPHCGERLDEHKATVTLPPIIGPNTTTAGPPITSNPIPITTNDRYNSYCPDTNHLGDK